MVKGRKPERSKLSPAKCHLRDAAGQPLHQRILAQQETPLQRCALPEEVRIDRPELRQSVEARKEPIFRRHVVIVEGNPLHERAAAINEFAYAVDQPLPAHLIGGVRPKPVRADGEEDDGNRGRSAVCPLLT